MQPLDEQRWLQLLQDDERRLAEVSFRLYQREMQLNSELADYSFIVFDMAKAYEGFLKRYLFQLQLIDLPTFESKRFRLGRALNPDVRHDQRDSHWLFDDLTARCGDEIARQLWSAWLKCRNRVFHYFPKEPALLTLEQAGDYLTEIGSTIEAAVMCDQARQFFLPRT